MVFSKLPIDTNTQKHFTKNVTIEISYNKLDLVMEQHVDFESLRANGYDVKKLFQDQGWLGYFDILNGPVYTELVKDFRKRCDIITQEDADREYENKSTIAELLRIPNKGIFRTFTPSSGRTSDYVERITQRCYLKEDAEPTNKVSDLKPT
ncbi:50S ribosomal protein L16, partial [Trifolium medium]|nr:50S ribosomal protein L16 [Trifolium medium]